MDSRERSIEAVLALLRETFGQPTADMYRTFYEDKPMETIRASADELLRETLGEARASREMKGIFLTD